MTENMVTENNGESEINNLQALENELRELQHGLRNLRKNELVIRQRLQEIENKKDPGMFLFKPSCNWNIEEEQKLKETLENIVNEAELKKSLVKKIEAQKNLITQYQEKLQSEKALLLKNSAFEGKKVEGESKKYLDREEEKADELSEYFHQKFLNVDRKNQLQYAQMSLESIEKWIKYISENMELSTNQKQEELFSNESIQEMQANAQNVSMILKQLATNDSNRGNTANFDEKTVSEEEILEKCIVWYLEKKKLNAKKMFHVKHLKSANKNQTKELIDKQLDNQLDNQLDKKLDKQLDIQLNQQVSEQINRKHALIYSVLCSAVDRVAESNFSEDNSEIELSFTENEVELYLDYYSNQLGPLEFLKEYEGRIKYDGGELISAEQEDERGKKSSHLIILSK